jgi:hypothetical protein
MAFEFLCPQGHLLEGDESQVGSECACPTCGCHFEVPAPLPPEPINVVSVDPTPDPLPDVRPESLALTKAADLEIVHIPCPSGHELETPREMLGQEALCPHCNKQFRLRLEKSLEYIREQTEAQRREDLKLGRRWLKIAIVLTTLVVAGLAVLLVLSAIR